MPNKLAALVLLLSLPAAPALAEDANEAMSCQDELAAAKARIAELEAAQADGAAAGAEAAAQAPEGYGKTRWGMSPAEVREVVPGLTEAQQGLVKMGKVGGRDAGMLYVFANGQLSAVIVAFAETHTAPNQYVADFSTVDELLSKKYGDEGETEPHWTETLYKDDPSNWGTAVLLGHLKLVTTWQNEHTGIQHTLQGGNFKAQHTIAYASRKLAETQQKALEADQMEDL